MLTRAFAYAAALHGEQRRKGTNIPYLSHLLAVAALVLEHGGTETQTVAALLHDAVEDHPRGGTTRREIQEEFGAEVLAIVEACTDADRHPKPPWKERKERYIAHVAEISSPARLVALADKVHNARAILRDFQTLGDALWNRFNASKAEVLWYYGALADIFLRVDGSPLAHELYRVVTELEALADETE
jgi:GTP pyrophosphokinase